MFTSIFHPFGIGFGGVLASQMERAQGAPLSYANRTWGGPRLLGSSWFSPFFVLRFGFAFLALLGASWGRLESLLASFWIILGSLGLVLGRLGLSWARFWAVRMACWSPITLNSHQLINSPTVEPMAGQHFAARAGGLRAARLEYIKLLSISVLSVNSFSCFFSFSFFCQICLSVFFCQIFLSVSSYSFFFQIFLSALSFRFFFQCILKVFSKFFLQLFLKLFLSAFSFSFFFQICLSVSYFSIKLPLSV